MTSPFAEAGGFLTRDPDAPAPDIQFHFVPIVLEDHGRTTVKAHGFSLPRLRAAPRKPRHGAARLGRSSATRR